MPSVPLKETRWLCLGIKPTTKVNGSSLVDLAGYRIYYGMVLGEYADIEEVDDPEITRHVVADLRFPHLFTLS